MHRFWIGEIPAEFYIELVIRSIFVYGLITCGMRYMGKRTTSQFSRSELAAIATLAAAGGLILLSPDRGLLPSIVVLGMLLLIKWFVNWRSFRSEKFEHMTEGRLDVMVSDGCIDYHQLKRSGISKEQLFSQLRNEEIIHLGELKRVYLEANGTFSIVKMDSAVPGLPVIPPWDKDFIAEQKQCPENKVCSNCGKPVGLKAIECPACEANDFVLGMLAAD
jgi:uncharacterized membrane protein YcaP (DUF421 family)